MRRTHSAGVAAATVAVLFAGTVSVTGTAAAAEVRGRHHHTHHAHHPAVSKGRIKALFDRWNAALATGDANRVADLYAPDAVLLPTVSSQIRTTRAARVDYFKHFLESKPVGRIQERHIKILSRDAAVDSGLYEFTLTNKDGSKSKVDARYTFVYERCRGKWLIINHHSSAVPAG
ncbi:SgcJ/EcaC family oxidoreductase [Streptomyces sp. ET3-23]|uniref:SgcJ/EcaC family oxidoreductase n=1 Tax=Streptomyces sp. ET3-23 TaxID=2885643 RepID=UPI001D0F8FF0|nr:SgcJ/EcaC family oxidoreductase [Streptomyces sp. ET3-23]MCC2274782.1 SgcJ/EcaC family oxidoreductase [Streptomyces sp. ET3-23]